MKTGSDSGQGPVVTKSIRRHLSLLSTVTGTATCVFQNGPFWGVLSKTSALRYVWRKTALQIQCNPPQPRAKHTTPPHVIIVIWHHAHNNSMPPALLRQKIKRAYANGHAPRDEPRLRSCRKARVRRVGTLKNLLVKSEKPSFEGL